MKPKIWSSPGCQDPKSALNYSFGTFYSGTVEQENFLSQTDNEMSGLRQMNYVLFFSQNPCSLVGPHESECLFTGPTVMLGLILTLLSFRLKMQEAVSRWHNSTYLSLQPGHNAKRRTTFFPHEEPWSCISWQKCEQKGKPSHRRCFFSYNDAVGILYRAFKPGKSIKLSVVAKCCRKEPPV